VRAALTRDGVAYRIRPIKNDDIERERAFIRGLSEESRYYRLMECVNDPPAKLVEQLVHVDGRRSMAFVAVTGERNAERFIGVARYAADDSSGACEFAVSVGDDWQSRGVGTTLMRLLFDHAKAAGFKRIYGTILADNARMIKLARWLGMQTERDRVDPRMLVASLDLEDTD
jgi:acetyltransferase